MPFIIDLLQGGSGDFAQVDEMLTRLNEELQLKFDEVTAKIIQIDTEVKEKEPPFLKEGFEEVAEGMGFVKEKVAAIEDRVRVLERVAAADPDEPGARKSSQGGKLDTRDIAPWEGPNDKEFVEFA